MEDKSSNIETFHNDIVAQPSKKAVDEAVDPAAQDRRQAGALNIVENPLTVGFTAFFDLTDVRLRNKSLF